VDVLANSAETPPVEMEIARKNTLPKLHFSDTEKLLDDLCINLEEYFKHTPTSFLPGLPYINWEHIWLDQKEARL